MKKTEIKCVFWDWEGTLTSQEMKIFFYIQRAVAKYNLPNITKEDIKSGLIKDFMSQEIANEIKKEIELHGPWFIPFAWHALKKIAQKNIKQGIVSNGISKNIKQELLQAPFNPFEIVMGQDCGLNPKPSPDMLVFALKKLEISPENACFVGDSQGDRTCAKEAGVKFFKVDETPDSYEKIIEII